MIPYAKMSRSDRRFATPRRCHAHDLAPFSHTTRYTTLPWPPPLSARWTALALFLFALAVHLFLAVAGVTMGMDFKALIVVDEVLAILAAPVLFALLLRVDLREAFALRSAHWSHYVMAGVAAIPLQLFGGAMMELVIEALPSSDMWREMIENSLETMLATDTLAGFLVLLFGGVVLAAVCEEILFRGMMLSLLTRGGRWRSAILTSAILFAVFHLDPIGLLPRTLMGVYFGLLVWKSGSIFPAMLAHGANNLLAFAVQPFADTSGPTPELSQTGLLAAVSGLLFVGLLFAYMRLTPTMTSGALAAAVPGHGDPSPDGALAASPPDGFSGAAAAPSGSAPAQDSSRHTDPHES